MGKITRFTRSGRISSFYLLVYSFILVLVDNLFYVFIITIIIYEIA